MNGYRSDSHSPCDTAVTSKESLGSTHESCDEDDVGLDDDNRSDGDGEEGDDSLDARPSGSPVAPLSLTTHKANTRSRSSSPVSLNLLLTPHSPGIGVRLYDSSVETIIACFSRGYVFGLRCWKKSERRNADWIFIEVSKSEWCLIFFIEISDLGMFQYSFYLVEWYFFGDFFLLKCHVVRCFSGWIIFMFCQNVTF